MAMPLRRLPALGSLRAFEAAARLSSFKAAASELAVTPGAISQQIRGLEDDLQVKLFTRAVRSVTLTAEGRHLQPALSAAFLQIRDAVDQIRPAVSNKPLTVAANGPVVSKYLLPRMHRFSERYPDLRVNIESGHDIRQPEAGEVFIRFFETPGQGVFSQKLCDEYVLPLASPKLIERLDLRKPADMLRAPLLHLTECETFGPSPDWPTWFARVGLNASDAGHGIQFHPRNADHAIEAAVNGMGVVLGRRFLSRTDMVEGRLVSPFGPMLPMNVSYFVVCREGEERHPDIAAFINWIGEETAAMANAVAVEATNE